MAELEGKSYCKCEKPIPVLQTDKKTVKCGECQKEIAPKPGLSSELVWVISLNPVTNQVDVKGAINQIGEFYKAVGIAKDIVRKWNELNGGYLNFQKTPPPKHGIMDFVRKK
jgi:hypothetical protein